MAAAGREPSDTAAVCGHGSADRRVAVADWIGSVGGQANRSKSGREEQLSEKSLQLKASLVSSDRKGQSWPLPWVSGATRMNKDERSSGAEVIGCIVLGTQDAKTEILVNTQVSAFDTRWFFAEIS